MTLSPIGRCALLAALACTWTGCAGKVEDNPPELPGGSTDASTHETGQHKDGYSGTDGVSGKEDGAKAGDAWMEAEAEDSAVVEAAAACVPPAGDLQELFGQYCAALVALPCNQGLDLALCQSKLQSGWAGLEAMGCSCQMQVLMACGVQNGLTCSTYGDDFRYNLACGQVEDDAELCMGEDDDCSWALGPAQPDGGGGTCQIDCDQYAADCVSNGAGGYDCTCTYGSKVGSAFTASDCSGESMKAACE